MNKLGVLCALAAVLILCVNDVFGQTNCRVGSDCDSCPEGQYQTVMIGTRRLKVCCEGCSRNCRAGNRPSDGRPYCTCYYPSDISGTCWKGEQCETCLNGPNSSYVGSINGIPVCCANCEKSGMMLTPTLCNCLHNGP